MDSVLTYRGRVITQDDVAFIRDLIAAHPTASRWALSKKLCEAWGWVQQNGALRDMVCRGLMLALHRAGHITLPARKRTPLNPLAKPRAERARPQPVLIDQSPLCGRLADLRPLEFRQVRRTSADSIFNGLVEMHHYLGYTQPVGEHLKYLISAQGRPVALFAWSSAPRHLGPRDRFIGWSTQARKQNIRFVAYNTRFLILPWVSVSHLASHLLGRMTQLLSADWERVYGHPIHFVETFVDPGRFRGTCYRAANWIYLGETTGRGKDAPTWEPNRCKKEVLGLPLTKRFRELLSGVE